MDFPCSSQKRQDFCGRGWGGDPPEREPRMCPLDAKGELRRRGDVQVSRLVGSPTPPLALEGHMVDLCLQK